MDTVITGVQNFVPYGKLKLEANYLFGLTTDAKRCGALETRIRSSILMDYKACCALLYQLTNPLTQRGLGIGA